MLHNRIKNGSALFRLAALAVLVLLIHFANSGFNFQNLFHVGAIRVFYSMKEGIIPIVAVSLCSLWVPTRWQGWFLIAVLVGVWNLSMNSNSVAGASPTFLFVCRLSLPLIAIAGWVYLRWTQSAPASKRGSAAWLLILFGAAVFLILYFLGGSIESLDGFGYFKVHFVVVSMIIIGSRAGRMPEDLLMSLNPANALRGMLWPDDSVWQSDFHSRLHLWWKGIYGVAFGYLMFFSRLKLETLLRGVSQTSFAYAGSTYELTLLTDVGALNVMAGVARLYGFNVRDATYFVFLARTPAEYWRRTAVYNNQAILRFVYIPLYRWFRMDFLCIMLAYSIFFLNYCGLGFIVDFDWGSRGTAHHFGPETILENSNISS